jgi:hypothetical protein
MPLFLALNLVSKMGARDDTQYAHLIGLALSYVRIMGVDLNRRGRVLLGAGTWVSHVVLMKGNTS